MRLEELAEIIPIGQDIRVVDIDDGEVLFDSSPGGTYGLIKEYKDYKVYTVSVVARNRIRVVVGPDREEL